MGVGVCVHVRALPLQPENCTGCGSEWVKQLMPTP